MSLQTYSREYLQSIPEKRKQEQIDDIVQSFINELRTAAAVGGTSYRYVRPSRDSCAMSYPPPPVLNNDDLIAGFQERFPGCKVFYEEVWVATGPNTQNLKKGIVIDWS